jgi:hypothetical protein
MGELINENMIEKSFGEIVLEKNQIRKVNLYVEDLKIFWNFAENTNSKINCKEKYFCLYLLK